MSRESLNAIAGGNNFSRLCFYLSARVCTCEDVLHERSPYPYVHE